jgi:uncharacterized membrane protein YdjX (TVP38/TMEM64 family)
MTAHGKQPADGDGAALGAVLGLRLAARLAVLGFLAAGAAAAWYWRAVLDPTTISAALARYPGAALGFLALHLAASLLFVPRTLLAIVAGLLFGMGWGIVWAASGGVAGAVGGFLVSRYMSSGWGNLGRFGPLAAQVERGGWRAVAVLRLIPVMPHSVANYALGLTKLPLGSYALGSLLGQLPLTIAYVDLGVAGERLLFGGASWLEPTLIGFGALLLSLLIPAIARWRARHPAAVTALGGGPPVAQSRSSAVCATGTTQPGAN